ncbi:hypothetical protein [Oscillatoria sp. CS-180]|uniref:hypothetical protein n=1 Tax=Oscillatoria sp. CS-180 TaxID=3021720 RepID=UPI00232AF5B4|nr:hypothetical protein [Oscillatoria sp. CS-180]
MTQQQGIEPVLRTSRSAKAMKSGLMQLNPALTPEEISKHKITGLRCITLR